MNPASGLAIKSEKDEYKKKDSNDCFYVLENRIFLEVVINSLPYLMH
jgi:hypothetical protein